MTAVPEFRFLLTPDARGDKKFLPTRAEPTATGWDVRACLPAGPLTLRPTQTALIPLGFKVFCPEGWWFEIRPRSSSFAKKNLASLYGIVDQDYHGDVKFACQFTPDFGQMPGWSSGAWDMARRTIEDGEALGQIVPVRRQEMTVSEVNAEEYERLCSERGGARKGGGFGSTDASNSHP